MVVAQSPVTPVRVPPPTAAPDPLAALVRSIGPAPDGVPQPLWESALAGPVRDFLSRPGKRFRARLVELSWDLAGRADRPPAALPLVVELLHAGSLIVDDIQDGSRQRRGRAALHHVIGVPLALNAGNWLYFWPLSLIPTLGLPAATELELHRRTADTLRLCHEGQALDLAARVGELHPSEIRAVALTISGRKTGSLMALAATLGAVAGGADADTVNALAAFGRRLGVGLQMQNDLSGLTGAAGPLKHPEDLLHGRVTWPWAWAAERSPAAQFDALQLRGTRLVEGTGDAAALARDLLAALGDDPGRPVREWLAAAVADLAAAVPAGPALDAVRAEVARLERRYT